MTITKIQARRIERIMSVFEIEEGKIWAVNDDSVVLSVSKEHKTVRFIIADNGDITNII